MSSDWNRGAFADLCEGADAYGAVSVGRDGIGLSIGRGCDVYRIRALRKGDPMQRLRADVDVEQRIRVASGNENVLGIAPKWPSESTRQWNRLDALEIRHAVEPKRRRIESRLDDCDNRTIRRYGHALRHRSSHRFSARRSAQEPPVRQYDASFSRDGATCASLRNQCEGYRETGENSRRAKRSVHCATKSEAATLPTRYARRSRPLRSRARHDLRE